tara:strand:+ start:550 stop:1413 length:864 start_codon:yes stop_codon:yes gene_type:complete
MKYIKYFFQYLIIKVFFIFFKIIGYRRASNVGEFIGRNFGPFFKSKKIIKKNILNYNPNLNEKLIENFIKKMWGNYGRIFAEYMFIKDFRINKLDNHLKINGSEHLNEIKKKNKPVVFISAHFSNFELMAMQIEKSGINLGAVYRPLNNIFLNKTMEELRKKYICKLQIKKGLTGLRDILKIFKNNFSIAMMIDQRVTEGITIDFFNKPAFTTSIPAQLVKKFKCPIVPVHIQRKNNNDFEITINKPIYFENSEDINSISKKLNFWLEEMISKNPEQWIWSHNRWKL